MPPRVLASGPKPCGGNNYYRIGQFHLRAVALVDLLCNHCLASSASLSLISQWILRTGTFISSHVVMVVIVLGAPSGKRGDWG